MDAGSAEILNLVFAKGLGDSISEELRKTDGWPFDLGTGEVEDREQIILSLWWFSNCIIRAVQVASDEEKSSFLDRVHDFIFRFLALEGLPEWALSELKRLIPGRYRDYYTAFHEDWKRLDNKQPPAVFTRIVTKNLFGRESNSVMVHVLITTVTQSSLIAFARVYNNQTGWASLRAAVSQLPT